MSKTYTISFLAESRTALAGKLNYEQIIFLKELLPSDKQQYFMKTCYRCKCRQDLVAVVTGSQKNVHGIFCPVCAFEGIPGL
jgi:hypothetical protein